MYELDLEDERERRYALPSGHGLAIRMIGEAKPQGG